MQIKYAHIMKSPAASKKQEQNDFYVPMGDEDVKYPPPSTSSDHLIRAFWQMATPYFRENQHGRRSFMLLIILMLANSAVRVYFSYLARDFWSALGDEDVDEFYSVIKKFLISLISLAPINVFYRFHRERLGIHWRKWMTQRILKLYYSNRAYYTMERSTKTAPSPIDDSDGQNGTKRIDNPDQRIAEDIKTFTYYSLKLFLTVSVSLIDLGAFSAILYSIKPSLFLSILLFAVFGTLITVAIGKTLVPLNFDMLQKEADFRYSLVRIRDNAESIAFFRGEAIEARQVNNRFEKVVVNAKEVIWTQRNLDFFTTLYNYLTWILPILVIAPEYFEGLVELGVVQQSASAFSHILDDLSIIINEFETLTSFSASIDRLFQFLVAVHEADPDKDKRDDGSILKGSRDENKKLGSDGILMDGPTSQINQETIQIREIPKDSPSASRPALAIHNLSLYTPDRSRTLIHSLTMQLSWGESLLILGSSGVGKSSLLRAIAGLWTAGVGTIERPRIEDIYFLPQRPYCPVGTLREQLLYPISSLYDDSEKDESMHPIPENAIETSDAELLEVLASIDLIDVATRVGNGDPALALDCTIDWSNTLSLGEQQRIGFGRIMVNKPQLVIIDESTSAMDIASEEKIYRLLKTLPSCTYISVGHRPSLLAFHDLRLPLQSGEPSISVVNNFTMQSTNEPK